MRHSLPRAMPKVILALAALAVAVTAAMAFHRQTPPTVQLTSTGDNQLPRLTAFGNTFVVSLTTDGGHNIHRYRHSLSQPNGFIPVTGGTHLNEHPTISIGGTVIAWDANCDLSWCAEAGRQIFMKVGRLGPQQVTHDPTGTSENPSLDGTGTKLAFESQGNFVGSNPPPLLGMAPRQIFVLSKGGGISQLTHGAGDSRNPGFNRTGRVVVFDSTTNPVSGVDTNVSQVWVSPQGGVPTRITSGSAPSRLPAVAADGKLVAFESQADLVGNGGDTGVTQIFAYETNTGRRYRITNNPSGCTRPSVDDGSHDWRVVFSCDGKVYVHHVVANVRYAIPILDSGDTPQIAAELGTHFVVVSTTSNLAGGTTSGHQLYLLNLYKLPVIQTASDAIQF